MALGCAEEEKSATISPCFLSGISGDSLEFLQEVEVDASNPMPDDFEETSRFFAQNMLDDDQLTGFADTLSGMAGDLGFLPEEGDMDVTDSPEVSASHTSHMIRNPSKSDQHKCLTPLQGEVVLDAPQRLRYKRSGESARKIYEAAEQSFLDNTGIPFDVYSTQNKELLRAWGQSRGVWLCIPDIFNHFSDSAYIESRGQSFYIKKLLGLVLQGAPIEYDKDAQKMMFLPCAKDILTPGPEENIFTLMYDLHTRYTKNLSIEECAYYAHKYGYWQNGFGWHGGVKSTFYHYIKDCRWRLVVLDCLPKEVLRGSLQDAVQMQADLWERVSMDGAVYEAKTYGSFVTQEDITDMQKLLEFSKTEEYQSLYKHVFAYPIERKSLKELEDFIRQSVRAKPLSKNNLQRLCRSHKNHKPRHFWQAVYHLVAEKGSGRVIYDTQNDVFCWGEQERHDAQKEDFLIRVFQLDGVRPKMTINTIVTVLRQEGFPCWEDRDLLVAKRSFMLFGVQKPENMRHIDTQRKFVNFMLDQGKTSEKGLPAAINIGELYSWDVRACRSALSFVYDKSLLRLLQFIGVQIVCSSNEATLEEPVQGLCATAQMIKQEMPALYSILSHQVFGERSAERTQADSTQIHAEYARKAYEEAVQGFAKNPVILPETLDAHQHTLLRVWTKKRGEWIAVREISPTLLDLPYEESKGPLFYVHATIDLVFHGAPVVYDKEEQKLMLSKGEKDILMSEPGENLSTLMYDLHARYKKNLSIEECAYYAHEYGYWQRGFQAHGGVKSQFYSYLEQCRWRLVTLGLIPKSALPKPLQKKAVLDADVWKRVVVEEKVHEAEHYGPLCTQEDVAYMKALLAFSQTGEYDLLKKHVLFCEKNLDMTKLMQFICKNVRAGPLSKTELMDLCREQRSEAYPLFWRAMQRLVCSKGQGRVRYDYNAGVFLWDDGCRPVAKQENYLQKILQLSQKYPEMGVSFVATILQQEGFSMAKENDVHIALHGFALLGIADESKCSRDVSALRRFINFLLQNKTKESTQMQNKTKESTQIPAAINVGHLNDWDKRICRRVVECVCEGQVLRLLLDCGALKKHDRCDSGEPPSKRRKVSLFGRAKVIKEEMPVLYEVLYDQLLQQRLKK